jgi:hypothetical protein
MDPVAQQEQAAARLDAMAAMPRPVVPPPLAMRSVAPNNWKKGLAIGAAVGVVVGVAAYAIDSRITERHNGPPVTVLLIPVAVCGVLGAFIGSFGRKG